MAVTAVTKTSIFLRFMQARRASTKLPKRPRDKEHLKIRGVSACFFCGRQPLDSHHVRFAQPRALGIDPPSLKWHDLSYVFLLHQGEPICLGGDTSLRRSSPS